MVSLSAAYFVATSTLDVMTNVGTIDDLTSSARIFLVLPVAVLDAVFILWIFTALSKTLAQLQARRQTAKLDLYRRFTNTMAISVVISVAWIGYEMWFKVSDAFNEKWETDWITAAFWHLLSLGITAVICILWRPTDAATQYAYSELDAMEDWAEEGAGGGGGGGGGVAMMGHAGGGGGKGQAMASADVFALDDDDDSAVGKMNSEGPRGEGTGYCTSTSSAVNGKR